MKQYPPVEKYLLAKPGAVKEFPFGPDAAVFKVGGKMFALMAWQEKPVRITLKSSPEDAVLLRSLYEAVKPGYYMNKKHWNTVTLDGSVPKEHLLRMMDESYDLVVRGLPRAEREKL